MKVYIRAGTIGDIPWMLGQLKELQLFFGSKKSLYHEESAISGLKTIMKTGLVLVAEKESVGRIGLIIGAITPHLFNPNVIVLAELLWWVDPAYRATSAGYLLLSEFVSWGKENVDWITFSLQSITPVNESTIKRFGFRHIEACYLIEVGCKHGSSSTSDSFTNDSRGNGGPS